MFCCILSSENYDPLWPVINNDLSPVYHDSNYNCVANFCCHVWRRKENNDSKLTIINFQVMESPNYPREYPGGLECLHTIRSSQGTIITLQIEDLDLEPKRDFVLIRDGPSADDRVLARLSGTLEDLESQFIVSTGNQLYVYTQTDQADSRKGFRIRYYEGMENVILCQK